MKRLIALIFGVATPRLTIIILAIFTSWFAGVFNSFIWPVLGFFFVPYTLLWYSVIVNWYGGVWGPVQTGILILAIIFDITPAKHLLGRK